MINQVLGFPCLPCSCGRLHVGSWLLALACSPRRPLLLWSSKWKIVSPCLPSLSFPSSPSLPLPFKKINNFLILKKKHGQWTEGMPTVSLTVYLNKLHSIWVPLVSSSVNGIKVSLIPAKWLDHCQCWFFSFSIFFSFQCCYFFIFKLFHQFL